MAKEDHELDMVSKLEDAQLSPATENQQATKEPLKAKFTNYLHDSTTEIAKSGKTLIEIMVSTNTFPFGKRWKRRYNILLIIFYLSNFVYTTVKFAIKRQYVTYDVMCILISSTGLFMKTVVPIVCYCIKYRRYVKQYQSKDTPLLPISSDHIEQYINIEQGHNMEGYQNQNIFGNIIKKHRNIVTKFIIGLIGEILIYSSMICALYGFIDDRGWTFNRKFAELDFALLMYNIVTDIIYTKLNYIGMLLKTVILLHKNQDHNNQDHNNQDHNNQDHNSNTDDQNENTNQRKYITPLSVGIVYAIILVIIYWVTLAIITVRIYADNSAIKRNESGYCGNQSEIGNYRSSSFTCYMIFCGFFLPVASTIQYILSNMGWFTPLYKAKRINKSQPPISPGSSVKDRCKYYCCGLIVKEPLAYLLAPFLILAFIGFMIGAVLPDYSTEECELMTSVRTTATCLAAVCIVFFVLSNFQTIIISIAIVVSLLFTLGILIPFYCFYTLYKYHINRHYEKIV
ncbi:uncharacterized protein [Dysidea avara]